MKFRLLAAATLAALALVASQAGAQDTTSERGKTSYGLGYRVGLELSRVLANDEQLDMNLVIKGLQDAAARKQPAVPGEQLSAAVQALNIRMEGRSRAQLEQRAAENKTKGNVSQAENRSSQTSAQDLMSEMGKASYGLGYNAGRGFAIALASGEQLDMDSLIKGLLDAAARKQPAVPGEQLGALIQAVEGRVQARLRAAENQTKGELFLAQNGTRVGVKVLPSGVQYRVIEAGSGARPTQESQITFEFRSTLPDGTVIEDTNKPVNGKVRGPYTVRLGEIQLAGLRDVLQMMPNGARWEVVLPASAAYGTSIARAGLMANQVLIFDIKLLSVGPKVTAPSAQSQPRN